MSEPGWLMWMGEGRKKTKEIISILGRWTNKFHCYSNSFLVTISSVLNPIVIPTHTVSWHTSKGQQNKIKFNNITSNSAYKNWKRDELPSEYKYIVGMSK